MPWITLSLIRNSTALCKTHMLIKNAIFSKSLLRSDMIWCEYTDIWLRISMQYRWSFAQEILCEAIVAQNWICDIRCHPCGAIVLLLSSGQALFLAGFLLTRWVPMRHIYIVGSLVQVVDCRLFDVKLLHKPMVSHCELDVCGKIIWKL